MADPYREPIDEKPELPVVAPLAPMSPAEQEIVALEQQLAQKRTALQEQSKPLDQILGQEQTSPPTPVVPVVPVPPVAAVAPSPIIQAEADKLKSVEKNQQIQGLVNLAFEKGVNYAADVARNLDNPYLIDEFHDTLIDELHKELVARGKLEEI